MSGDAGAVRRLGALIPDVNHPVEGIGTLTYVVTRSPDGGYAVTEEGDLLSVEADVGGAVDAMYVRAYRRAFEYASLAGWVRLHAVTADIADRRHLIVGASGSGKTSLALALIANGHRVQGDESVMVRAGQSFAVPRGFHVKRAAVGLVERFRGVVDQGVAIGDVVVVDPRALDPDWTIDIARVDDVVILVGNGSPPAVVSVAAPHIALETLVREAFVVTGSKSALLATVLSVTSGARCRSLTRGPLDEMCAALTCEPD